MKGQKVGVFFNERCLKKGVKGSLVSTIVPALIGLWSGFGWGGSLGAAQTHPLLLQLTDRQDCFVEFSQENLQRELTQEQPAAIKFCLYKALLIHELQAYDAKQGEIESLAALLRPAFSLPADAAFLEGCDQDQKNIFQTYSVCIELAHRATCELTEQLLESDHSFSPEEASQLYSLFPLYFLELLELEETLNFHLLGADLLIERQMAEFSFLFSLLEKSVLAKRAENEEETFIAAKESLFYHHTLVPLVCSFLHRIDREWKSCDCGRDTLLELLLGPKACALFPYERQIGYSLVERVLPFLQRYGEAQSAEERLAQEAACTSNEWNAYLSAFLDNPTVDESCFEPVFYFLEILSFEESSSLDVFGSRLLIEKQVAFFKNWVQELALKKQAARGQPIGEASIAQFYWSKVVPLSHRLLTLLENRFFLAPEDRADILTAVFGSFALRSFPLSEEDVGVIERFWPFLILQEDLELAKARFEEETAHLAAWDRAFKWVALHVKAAQDLLCVDSVAASNYLVQAKKLTDNSLWSYSFSFNWSSWNDKRVEALELIEACQKMLKEIKDGDC